MSRAIGRALAPLARGIQNAFSRGVVSAVNAAAKMQGLQVQLLASEGKDAIEHFEPYGFTAHAHPGAEVAVSFVEGDRSHGIALVVADRRYRIAGMEAGEVCVYDDLGQKVHLTRDGIVIHTDKKVRVEAEDIELHANKSWSWDVHGFGERWTWLSGTEWEHKTWQQGATVTAVTLPINPPEGP